MGRKASLTPTKRAQIVALNDLGYSERKIAMKLTCSKTAVHTALANHRVRGSYTDQKRTGRPRKTTPQDDRVIRRAVVKSPSSSLTKLRSILLDRGVRLDKSTISRRYSGVVGGSGWWMSVVGPKDARLEIVWAMPGYYL
ncbi:hypothetical protein CAPTEDRAFT_216647 [Capitella teleta]|uniref:Transposase IS30-like HTH domain-containing protein n=1 Tax=Capitella teleta TaxID=283909 RepID=R7UBJ5_CAPTE|nr:hypothetical protein CAPTEDRAFT_216647 [Capitella teleta]|eukprot:ELU01178.1 hypothetical protein CAPTEDRAFT_216647 [Capitella teleta]